MGATIDGLQGRSVGVDAVSTFSITASGTVTLIPSNLGRRDYIKVYNNDTVAVRICSSTLASGTAGFYVKASGGTFEDYTNAPLYIVSTGANAVVSIYERKNK